MTSKRHVRDEEDFVAIAPTPPIKGRQLELRKGSRESRDSYVRLTLLVVPIELLQCFQIHLGTDQSVPTWHHAGIDGEVLADGKCEEENDMRRWTGE